MSATRLCLALTLLGALLPVNALAQAQPPPPREGNLKVVSRPAPDAPPFSDADQIRYVVYRQAQDGRAGETIDTDYGGDNSEAWFSLAPGRYVVSAAKGLAEAEAPVEVLRDKVAAVDIVVPAGVVEARAMASAEVAIRDPDVRWTVADRFGRQEEEVGLGLAIAVPPGTVTVTARLGSASATASVEIDAAKTTKLDLVLNAATLLLKGKRSAAANEYDDNIRWEVSGRAGEPMTDYGQATFHLAAGEYRVKASLGLATGYAELSLAVGETMTREFVVPTGRVTVHALFAEGGPTVTANPLFEILEPEAGPDGEHKVLASSYHDGSVFDLPPADYLLRVSSDVAKGEKPFRVEAGVPIEVSVVLNAGVLTLGAKGGSRLDVLAGDEDIYGKRPVIATRYAEEATLALPAGAYEVKVTRKDGSERTAPAVITAGQRTDVVVE